MTAGLVSCGLLLSPFVGNGKSKESQRGNRSDGCAGASKLIGHLAKSINMIILSTMIPVIPEFEVVRFRQGWTAAT